MRLLRGAQITAPQDRNTLAPHFGMQRRQHPLLSQHQIARVFVDHNQLFTGAETVGRRGGVALACQFAKARNSYGVEFVEVRGRN